MTTRRSEVRELGPTLILLFLEAEGSLLHVSLLVFGFDHASIYLSGTLVITFCLIEEEEHGFAILFNLSVEAKVLDITWQLDVTSRQFDLDVTAVALQPH